MEKQLMTMSDMVIFRGEYGTVLEPDCKIKDVDSVITPLPERGAEALKEINMTPEEKDEFDKLKRNYSSLILALETINNQDFPNLTKRLVLNKSSKEDNKALLDFTHAWIDPDLIIVGPKEKYYTVRVPHTKEMFYYKDSDNDLRCGTKGNEPCFKFTADELVHYNFDLPLYKKEEVEL